MKFRLFFVFCLVGLVALFTAWLMFVFDLEVTMSNVVMVSAPFLMITVAAASPFVVVPLFFLLAPALLKSGVKEKEKED